MSREIDIKIAEHVFGYEIGPDGRARKDRTYKWSFVPPYSTNIADAWLVVEKMRESELYLKLEDFSAGFRCEFITCDCELEGMARKYQAPMSICIAALNAKGIDVE